MFLDKPFSWILQKLQLWDIITPVISNSKIILVPHAGVSYSGACAYTAYATISWKNVKNVIMLCTAHTPNVTLETEHSYYVNKAFVDYFLPQSHTNFTVYLMYHDLDILSNKNITEVVSDITKSLSIDNNTVVVATSDLSHYGPQYRHSSDIVFPVPQQSFKEQIEQTLIQALQDANPTTVTTEVEKVTACGPGVIKAVAMIANILGYKGKVLCYYDSTDVSDDLTKTLSIKPESKSFVSYVSMTFSKDIDPIKIHSFDKFYLLSRVRSLIENQVSGHHITKTMYNLPLWSPWHVVKNGAFVGIQRLVTNKVRASIGNYESPDRNIIDNILNSAEGCILDAISRWGGPITVNELPKLEYYINILQSQSDWVKITYEQFKQKPHIMIKCVHGIHLDTRSGSSATYLPSVWCENPQWSWEVLLNQLVQKAGENQDALNKSTISLYTTEYIKQNYMQRMCIYLDNLDLEQREIFKKIISDLELTNINPHSNDLMQICRILETMHQ